MNELVKTIELFFNAHQQLFLVVGIVSAALFVCSLVLVPIAVVNLPEDHFVKPKSIPARRTLVRHAILLIVRNVLGIPLLLLGIVLLVLPGPGWLTILAGIALIDLPFKHKLEMKILSLPVVRNSVNAARAKRGKKPFLFQASDDKKTTDGQG